jgi:hypothetical protein
MDTQFYILISLKTWKGLESFAKFSLGNDRDLAYETYQQLKGTDEITYNNVLYLEFREIRKGLPVNLKIKSCTLNELMQNCAIITKEVFKWMNMGPESTPGK